MTYLTTKKAIGTFMLVLLMPGQPVFAQTVPVEAAETMTSTQSGAVIAPDVQPTVQDVQPTVQDVLLNVCEANGYGQDCAKTLLGMLWTESSNRSDVIGDHGRAVGYFQIWPRLHNIPVSCAEDLMCSANWTLDYLEAHSYPKYVNYAVQCHNSCGLKNGYAAKVQRYAKTLWDEPLEIDQEAPIELAAN